MIYHGDSLEVLKGMPSEHFSMCVTSPPYWGLRDYGIEGQLGMEKTPEEYVQNMVSVFREVCRVLKDDGTLWLNLGDSYSTTGKNRTDAQAIEKSGLSGGKLTQTQSLVQQSKLVRGLKAKDLVGIPWMTAFALRADGWFLRQDIIWHKPNPMPESVTDRCTKAHEYIFLFSKSQKYHFDYQAIKEKAVTKPGTNRGGALTRKNPEVSPLVSGFNHHGEPWLSDGTRNRRSVWSVSTKPFKGAHFATFPPDLIEPCILAGSPKDGIVLDPFFGAGTTGLVAQKHGRRFVGIELNAEYIEIAKKRLGTEPKTESVEPQLDLGA